jgi:hypothetical protein
VYAAGNALALAGRRVPPGGAVDLRLGPQAQPDEVAADAAGDQQQNGPIEGAGT